MTTRLTNKFRLRLAILHTTMTTLTTSSASVARVNKNELHASKSSLVSQELPQLKETPTTHPCSLLTTKPSATSDAFQIFNGKASVAVLRLTNKLLTDYVVGMFLKIRLTSRQTFNQAVNRTWTLPTLRLTGSLMLQNLALLRTLLSYSLNVCARECLSVRVSGNVDDSKVNAQD